MLDRMIGLLPTKDAGKSRAFYEHALGFRFVREDPFALVMDAHGTMIRLVKIPEFTPAAYTVLGWEVADIEQEVRRLQGSGVSVERYGFFEQDELGIWTAPDGSRVAWFRDPDGNTLSVSKHA